MSVTRRDFFKASSLLAALVSGPAFAHVTLETSQAIAGSTYKAVVRVPHGCDGAATTRTSACPARPWSRSHAPSSPSPARRSCVTTGRFTAASKR